MDLISEQVPRYLLIGNGRVARHFSHYFSLLQIPHSTWSRHRPIEELSAQIKQATHILVLISDKAIDSFIAQYLQNVGHALVMHFSGSLLSSRAFGAHPLMTFSDDLYPLEQYLKIPFVIDHNAPDFVTLLPGLNNPHYRLNTDLKAKYHALCVLSGNLSCLLWKKLFYQFQEEFNIPEAVAHPYLLQQTQNLIANSKTALTGPLVRGDQVTIEKNLHALDADPFKELYESFISCFQQSRGVLL
jgi:2-dehydropantoate 2-reductase